MHVCWGNGSLLFWDESSVERVALFGAFRERREREGCGWVYVDYMEVY